MILLLGGSGYVGSAYQQLFLKKQIPFRSISRADVNYYDRQQVVRLIRETRATFLINAAGYTGKPNVDACEIYKTECTLGNTVLPGVIMEACTEVGIPWGHVSSGCIYNGRRADGNGFTEQDTPNFSFRTNNCSFYSGTKALGEEILADAPQCYVWRLRIPFNHCNSSRNYLTKLMRYASLLEAENSISHLEEFVETTFACWEKKIPYGIYNLTNPGAITTHQVVQMILDEAKVRMNEGRENPFPAKKYHFFESEAQFMSIAAKTPRSNCVLDTTKLESFGLKMRSAETAIRDALKNWIH